MNTCDRRRRTWWCRLAERLDVVTGVDDGGSDSPLHRRARRHVDHCAYCRAEREAWARVSVGCVRSSVPWRRMGCWTASWRESRWSEAGAERRVLARGRIGRGCSGALTDGYGGARTDGRGALSGARGHAPPRA